MRTIHFTIYINTVLRIFKWNSRTYINTITIITLNNTINLYSRITTRYSTWLIKTCLNSLNSSRHLINTICRIYFTTIITNITNSSTRYINTTIRTFNCTIYINTILIIFELSTWIYQNTTTAICIVTFNIPINWYSINCTIYSSRLLINTICSICFIFTSNMTNSSTRYINTINITCNSIFNHHSISFTIYRTL